MRIFIEFSHCNLKFSFDRVLIQDLRSNKKIGSIEVHKDLYMLTHHLLGNSPSHNFDNSINTITLKDLDIWHFLLGHPSPTILLQLCNHFPYIHFNKNLVCDPFYMAKQVKFPFSNRSIKSSHIFELIHMDIWGPLNSPTLHDYQYFLTIVDDYSR